MQVKGRSGDQDVELQPQHTRRLPFLDAVYGGVAHLRGIDDGHSAAAFDLHRLVRADDGRGVFVEPDADCERVVGERGQEAPQAVALAEMLIDDEAIREPQAGGQPDAPGDHRRALIARGDHVLGKNAGAGTRATHGDAACVGRANEPGDRCAAEERGKTQLVAAGEEDPARFLETREPALLLAVTAGIEIHDRDASGTDVGEQLLVARPRLVHTARGRYHNDVGLPAPRSAHEALEDASVVLLVLRAADGDDPAALCALGNSARHPLPHSLYTRITCRLLRREGNTVSRPAGRVAGGSCDRAPRIASGCVRHPGGGLQSTPAGTTLRAPRLAAGASVNT